MQTSTSPAAQAPAAQAPAAPPAEPGAAAEAVPAPAAPQVVVDGQPLPTAATLTPEQAALLRARREELEDQSENVAERRQELAEQHRTADEGAQTGLEQRIAVLDQQLIDIERSLAQTNRELLGAPPPPAQPVVEEPRVFGFESDEATAMGTVFMLVVLMPLAIAYARLLWKRATRIERTPVVLESPQSQQRMERVEQAVEAIALEVERVSEGQRFVTKLLSEARPGSPIGAAREREPVLVEERARDRQAT